MIMYVQTEEHRLNRFKCSGRTLPRPLLIAFLIVFIYPFLRIVSNCSKVNFFGFPYLSFCKLYRNMSHTNCCLPFHVSLASDTQK